MKKRSFAIIASWVAVACLVPNLGRAQDAGVQDDDAMISPEKSKPPKPVIPPVMGAWCGTVQDNFLGAGSISLSIHQKKSKLTGTWTDDFGGNGTLTGKIVGDALSVKLKDRANKCKLAVNGTLVSPGEVSGNYSQFGCKQADGGSFDITTPGC